MSSVWVQLYYEDKDKGKVEPHGRPVEIEPIPKNINALAKATKKELLKELDHAGLTEIFVYPPKSSGDENKYKSGKKLSEVIDELKNTTPPTSDYHPLIVVAPDPLQQPQQQADGKKCFRFGFYSANPLLTINLPLNLFNFKLITIFLVCCWTR